MQSFVRKIDALYRPKKFQFGPKKLKKLIRIWRALHEYVNFVHDPEKQYRSLSEWSATAVCVAMSDP